MRLKHGLGRESDRAPRLSVSDGPRRDQVHGVAVAAIRYGREILPPSMNLWGKRDPAHLSTHLDVMIHRRAVRSVTGEISPLHSSSAQWTDWQAPRFAFTRVHVSSI